MDLTMTTEQQDAFLTDVHIGILGVERPDGPPSLTPVWYRYLDGVVQVVTSSGTAKVGLLTRAGHASLCVQRETGAPAYVTVEGPVTVGPTPEGLVTAIAERYLGPEKGAEYAAGQGQHDDTMIALQVERRRSADFSQVW